MLNRYRNGNHTHLDAHDAGLLLGHQRLYSLIRQAQPQLPHIGAVGGRFREVYATAAAQQLRFAIGVGDHFPGQRVVRHQRLRQRRLQHRGRVTAASGVVRVAEEDSNVDGRQEEVQVGQRQAVLLHRQRRRHHRRGWHDLHIVAVLLTEPGAGAVGAGFVVNHVVAWYARALV
jgi:hypothetical protein